MQAVRSFKGEDRFGAIIIGDQKTVSEQIHQEVNTGNFRFDLTDYGCLLVIGDALNIPVPIQMIDHLGNTGLITIYSGSEQSYELVPIYNIPVLPSAVFEVKGAFIATKAGCE